MTRRWRPTDVTVRLLLWAVLPLLFFTASIGKQPRYILPILPPLAVLLARTLERRLAAGDGRRDPLLRAATSSIGILLVALGALLMRALPLIVMIAPVLVVVSAGAIIAAGVRCHRARLCRAVAPHRHRRRHRRRCDTRRPAVRSLARGPRPRAGYGRPGPPAPPRERAGRELPRVRAQPRLLHGHQAGRPLGPDELRAYLRSPSPVLLVVSADDLARIDRSDRLPTRVLGEVLYFNASAVKLRTLLRPDPGKDLDRVLLVTNR